MNHFSEGIHWGEPTERERELILFLGECIANGLEKYNSNRGELICAFSLLCSLIFTEQTPIKDVEDQCREIDSFCEFIKLRARKGK
jgi:hypothetical protein